MPEHSNKPPCDSYEMPLCETTRTDTSKVLSNMLDMMAQMKQEIFEALLPKKEDMSSAHNSSHENPCIADGNHENYDYGDELNIIETVSDPIDIAAELTVKVEAEDELTTNMELKPILNKSVEKSIHFLAIVKKVPTEEVNEFDSILFDNNSKA
ncbi:hypothetical protein J1N35_004275 [Gossypium stocksii]|uniref:Uncharacterized protein n=1 Tax=Gossypium stocksii TaxID=47602 RepID=A0A9D4AI35_9ROSI|nr:hypothetical protein J1N35_004275 [Gossypium stocksii]